MGQAGGKESGGAGSSLGSSMGQYQKFLDFYDVGDRLGEGSFGVVYKCNKKGQPTPEYAVKMVDKVESPPDEIKKEAEFIKNLTHHHIVKCHDVINEKCFVCIVVDLFKGGDLINCMQLYWQRGKIPYEVSLGLTYQMCSALEYLHAQLIIHRDVKADNYLCDRKDIGDPDVRIILTDFGTAKKLSSISDKCRDKTGTKLYWSPEFYKLDYGVGVDVWAVGVVLYGLIAGSFPFKNKVEVNSKILKWPANLPAATREFALKFFERVEANRITAAAACAQPILATAKQNAQRLQPVALEAGEKANQEDQFEETGANNCIKDRRAELVERMQDSTKRSTGHDVVNPPAGGRPHYLDTNFAILNKREGHTKVYEWWGGRAATGVMDHFHHIAICHKPSTAGMGQVKTGGAHTAAVDLVTRMLEEHGIDTRPFGRGTAKSLEDLAMEVQNGSCMLKLDAANYKKLVRVVDFVGVRVCRVKNGVKEYAIETKEKFADGRERATNRLPGLKKEPYQNAIQAAETMLQKEMNLQGRVHLDLSSLTSFEKEEMSPSYPGVFTVYRSELLEGALTEEMPDNFSHVEANGETRFFTFMSEAACERAGIQYKGLPPGQGASSSLVDAPLGFDPEQLQQFLQQHRIESANFGKGKAASLQEFSDEVMKGECQLRVDDQGRLVRVVDVVLLKLTSKETGKLLVQVSSRLNDGSVKKMDRLPGCKRRPDENPFISVKKVIRDHLMIDENHVIIDASSVEELEEEQQSVTYPGLPTVYHKRVISGELEGEVSDNGAEVSWAGKLSKMFTQRDRSSGSRGFACDCVSRDR